ncbi:uncharacterized protein PRCAT00004780001 [Priceomyces carsonii]|uniref:uncharacterized protein n=1 Tax=Priceomyces carsonii TaxID=28549 RepID=UPI002ED7DB32|nr:unnamed protein product [Priceomyces carsonii]
MSNLDNHGTGHQTVLPDYRSAYQMSHSGTGVTGSSTSGPSGVSTTAGGAIPNPSSNAALQPPSQTSQMQPSPYSQMPQRASSTIPQSIQQYAQSSHYPDLAQQYQQLLNSNYGSSIQQQPQQQMMNQPYTSYYMFSQQPLQAPLQQQPQQPQLSQQPSTGAGPRNSASEQSYAYARYPYATATAATPSTSAAAPGSNYATMYQQSIPQINKLLSQPQSRPYNQVSSNAANAYSAASSDSSQLQRSVNPVSNSSVGQYQPPGVRPRVTTTMWEDEKTLCYQVDANNVSVVRRADNNMINGTKLLNVAQMTRGRRDGILKSEKVRHVVKIGSMHLKGVWIPFERALSMAQREGIVDLLYPLFVRDIKRVIQTGITPTNNSSAAGASMTAKSASPSNGNTNYGMGGYYQQYNKQYAQNGTGGSGAIQQSPQQASNADIHQASQHQPPQAQQMYGYQQPYYAANQYYQPYNPSNNYSSYGSQPMYSGYSYINQQVPQQVSHQTPSSSAANLHSATSSTQPLASGDHTSTQPSSHENPNGSDTSGSSNDSVDRKKDDK